jgi:hypothetical protein
MNLSKKDALPILGLLMVAEGLLLRLDFSLYGIPSIIVWGFHLHHWLIGLGLIIIWVILGE